MKRVFPVIIWMLLSGALAVCGQSIESMGLKAGVSLSNQNYRFTPIDYTLETEPVAGPGIAVFVESSWREHLSFQLDLAFAGKGSKTATRSVTVNHLDNDRIVVNEGDLHVSRFYYLSFSPLARYRLGLEHLEPYALLGPRLDFLLAYRTSSETPLDWQNGILLGLSGGAGLEFKPNDLGVFLEVQYQHDISPVTGLDPLMVRNYGLLITLGVRYLRAP